MKFSLLVAVSCLAFVTQAWGNAAPMPRTGPAPAPGAPPFRGQPKAVEVKSEKFKLAGSIAHGALRGEGEKVVAKIVLPQRLRETPPPAGAPAKVGRQETSPRSLVAAAALSLAAVSIVFVVRGKRLSPTSKAAILGLTVMTAGYAVAQANAPAPPARKDPPTEIVVEFSTEVEEAILILQEKK